MILKLYVFLSHPPLSILFVLLIERKKKNIEFHNKNKTIFGLRNPELIVVSIECAKQILIADRNACTRLIISSESTGSTYKTNKPLSIEQIQIFFFLFSSRSKNTQRENKTKKGKIMIWDKVKPGLISLIIIVPDAVPSLLMCFDCY